MHAHTHTRDHTHTEAHRTRVTRWVEFDAGHRVPFHGSKCKHLHGHRYKVGATVEGPVQDPNPANPESGMVLDFGMLKELMMLHVHDKYDHRTVLWEHDPIRQLRGPVGHASEDVWSSSVVVVPFIPTAENFASAIFAILDEALRKCWGDRLCLVDITVYETPTCYATHTRKI